jgi:hypothetical protein
MNHGPNEDSTLFGVPDGQGVQCEEMKGKDEETETGAIPQTEEATAPSVVDMPVE